MSRNARWVTAHIFSEPCRCDGVTIDPRSAAWPAETVETLAVEPSNGLRKLAQIRERTARGWLQCAGFGPAVRTLRSAAEHGGDLGRYMRWALAADDAREALRISELRAAREAAYDAGYCDAARGYADRAVYGAEEHLAVLEELFSPRDRGDK